MTDADPPGALFVVDAPRPSVLRGVAVARILIVEDEARIASFVAKGLRSEGHVATVAGDGQVGLDHALSGDFDLVVLDIGPARHGRLRGARPAPRSQGSTDAGDRADRPRLGGRHGVGTGGRRGRLHAQAVPVRRGCSPGCGCGCARPRRPTPARTARGGAGGGAAYISTSAPGAPGRWPAGRPVGRASSRWRRSSSSTPARCSPASRLLDHVWGFDFDPGSNVVDVYVGYLRRKFGADTITTVRGIGLPLSTDPHRRVGSS